MPSGKSLPNIHIITPYTNLHLPEKGGGDYVTIWTFRA